MTIAAATITTYTGVTYSTGTDPLATQVATFITAGKQLFRSVGYQAPDETDEEHVAMVCMIVADLISNYLRQKMLSNPSQFAGTVPEYRNPMPHDRLQQIRDMVLRTAVPTNSFAF